MQGSSAEERLTHNQEVAGSTPAPAPIAKKRRYRPTGPQLSWRAPSINRGAYETMGSARIDLHYAKLGIDRRWTWERFLRLAGYLRLTTGELASTVRISHGQIETCHRANRFPPPVALLLTLLESHVTAGLVPDAIQSPLPNLNPLVQNG